ncbi:GNAT family N-acetyltransferase [Mobilicoccus caccae]|uniref:N-acetyltransferase n=1 Tax=Mobilicoccus caccae TaxID=1859295 RepID=A0ABQ6IVZ3_9MICO|nr:GNAT family N-acetyltransferase [Mobilicoccus caccae]GMA41586.1 N-acetyltransferase [Mobilicoccus caccae]
MNLQFQTPGLPPGWTARDPDERDIAPLAWLRAAVTRAATGSGTPDVSTVMSEITDVGSWTRRQVAVFDRSGAARAWAAVHDRAAGRTLTHVTIDPALEVDIADPLAASLFSWCEKASGRFASLRGRDGTQLDTGSYEGDARQRRWLQAAGFERTRRWLQMSRPVTSADDDTFPELPNVDIRRVRRRPNGNPVAVDVQAVHWVLEESFEDHFNAYRESFPEFILRLQEDPGHTWDHWWLAIVHHEDGTEIPGGAIVATMTRPDDSDAYGSYVDYIGVHRDARGRGIAKGLLNTVIADAASRGRNRVGLEVDDSSPTGADGLYRALGWETSYVTESWHRDVTF